jgi:hypothetical protein
MNGPHNCSVYTEYTVIWVLQSFYTSNYFTLSLSQGDMCLSQSWPSFDYVIWTFDFGSPSDTDYSVHRRPLTAWLLLSSAPIILSGCETKIGS